MSTLSDAVLAYHEAIESCANDPERMSSFCTAEGDHLDALYLAMVKAAKIEAGICQDAVKMCMFPNDIQT